MQAHKQHECRFRKKQWARSTLCCTARNLHVLMELHEFISAEENSNEVTLCCLILSTNQVAKAMSDFLGPEASVKVCGMCISFTADVFCPATGI